MKMVSGAKLLALCATLEALTCSGESPDPLISPQVVEPTDPLISPQVVEPTDAPTSPQVVASAGHEAQALPYSYDALAPVISQETLRLHHDKHYRGYVNNTNKLIANDEALTALSLEELIREATTNTSLFNNAAQIWNHELYFRCFQPAVLEEGSDDDYVIPEPQGALLTAINSSFGSLQCFKDTFELKAGRLFGSGWVWLVYNAAKEKPLFIHVTPNGVNPIKDESGVPLLGIDVWEHSYYIDYQNRRKEHLKALWKIINWGFVASNYADAIQ